MHVGFGRQATTTTIRAYYISVAGYRDALLELIKLPLLRTLNTLKQQSKICQTEHISYHGTI